MGFRLSDEQEVITSADRKVCAFFCNFFLVDA